MKLSEFVSKLKNDARGEVTLSGGIKLRSSPFHRLTSTVLADALGSFLPEDAEVHSGWHLATLGEMDSPKHEWLLIVGEALVLLRATKRDGQHGDIHDISIRELPLAEVVPALRRTYFTEFRGGSTLTEAAITFTAGETFTMQMEGRDGREAFETFARELRAAIERAREASARGRI